MKKNGIICMVALMLGLGLSSCAETAEKKESTIAYKIENKEALSEDDYAAMIDYVGEYAQKAQKYVDMQINGENLDEASEGIQKLDSEFPYVNLYRNCIRFTPITSLSEANLKKIGEYAGFVEFTAPAGYTLQTNPDDAGLIEATPMTDNGVVAGAVDTTKVEKGSWQ